jgi:glucosamine kinase
MVQITRLFMPIYIGIDGGGSKTACAVGDDAVVLGIATAGGSNIIRLGEEQARAGLQTAITTACATAGVNPQDVVCTCVGTAGASVTTAREAVQKIVGAVVAGKVEVVGDMEVALEAAFGGGPGVIVIAGTGSIAFASDGHGHTARAGGWGHAISDEGSGNWIGRLAVSAAMRAGDRRQASCLEEMILNHWRLAGREELVKMANRVPGPDFSQLFPVVVAAATNGDEVARHVLTEAGTELAELALGAVRALWQESQCVRVALVGGVLRHSTIVRHTFYAALRTRRPNLAVCMAVVDPVAGALALARKRAALSR